MAATTKIRWKVYWQGVSRAACFPLPDDATVAELVRKVRVREGLPRQDDQGAEVDVEIQLEDKGERFEVSEDTELRDLVPVDSEDAKFVAILTGGEGVVTPVAPSPGKAPAPVEPALAQPPATSAPGTPASNGQPGVTPRSTQKLLTKIPSGDAALAGATGGEPDTGRPASATGSCCSACNMVFSITTPTVCCRACGHLFHSECAGYNTSISREFPPPDWICPRCPDGERGPSATVHRSLKGKGTVNQQRGNQPWCPICLGDNREPGIVMLGSRSLTRCRGCGLHTHAKCLKNLEVGRDGRWPCDECTRRRDGVVRGENNPVWLRLKAARLDGGWDAGVETERTDAGGVEYQDQLNDPQQEPIKSSSSSSVGSSASSSVGCSSSAPVGRRGMAIAVSTRIQSRRTSTPRRADASGTKCEACGSDCNAKRPSFCCRKCGKSFHGACAGYHGVRQAPPPDWICPHCPNGERGPNEKTIHPSLKGKGTISQARGNQPWCPICLSDNRISGKRKMGDAERCPGCDFHTHADCLAGFQLWSDGRWTCDECQRRRDGVVIGDNPVWRRLKAARLDGGQKPTWTHDYGATGTITTPAATDTSCSKIGSIEPIADSQAATDSEASDPSATAGTNSRRPATAERRSKSRGMKADTGCCGACNKPLHTNSRASFCCRTCNGLFHGNCVGYHTRNRQFPPPDWICPRCPNGERGPSASCLHQSLEDMGTVRQKRGNYQWCPICLGNNRTPSGRMAEGMKRCLGCGLQAHARCRTEDGPGGSWPCDECQRRKDGVVPGDNNPVWVRLKAARMEGGRLSSRAPITPPAADAVTYSPSFDNGTLSEATAAPGAPSLPLTVSNYRSQELSDAEESAAAAAAVEAEAASFRRSLCGPPLQSPLRSNETVADRVVAHPWAGSQRSTHVRFSDAVAMAICAAEAAGRVAAPPRPPTGSPMRSTEVFGEGSASPQAAESRGLAVGSPSFDQALLPNDLGPSGADAAALASSNINDEHEYLQPHSSDSSGRRETAVAAGEATSGAKGREEDPEERPSQPAAAATANGSKGTSSIGDDVGTSMSVGLSSCEACRKIFVPSSRPSFCCRSCHGLFHGECAGFCRHKRQCPPPDWICPRCPNGERGPTGYEVHHSLRGKGTVTQQLGNQRWCPICLNDDRAPGSTQRERGSKKCPGCGLLAHGHCLAGVEVGPDGRWPCGECQRRQDGVVAGSDTCLRLKAARMDGGLPPSTVPPAGTTATPATTATGTSTDAAPIAGSPISNTVTDSNDPASWRFDAATTASAGEAATASTPLSFASLGSSFMLPQRATASAPTAAAAPTDSSVSNPNTLESPTPGRGSSSALSDAANAPASSTVEAERSGVGEKGYGSCLSESRDGSGAAAARSAAPPRKKARMAGSSSLWQLRPRSAIRSRGEAAETIALAAALLCGGTSDQLEGAKDFVATELAKHNQDVSNRLIEKLMGAANLNEDGVWVNRKTLMDDLCGTKQAPSEFACVIRFIIGTDSENNTEMDQTKTAQQARQCFRQALLRSFADKNAFEALNVGGQELLWWKGSNP